MGTAVPQEFSPAGGSERSGAPYVQGGRSAQKSRTRQALVNAARDELARGVPVTVESVAAAAGISRTTAYRYFRNHRELVAAAHPQIDSPSLLPDPAPADPAERLALVMHSFLVDVTVAWEPQLRAALQLSLQSPREQVEGAPTLRQGRAIGWILEALEPLRATHPEVDLNRLARAIRSAAGIESLVWLTDVAGLSREEAVDVMAHSAQALLRDALDGPAE